MTNPPDIDLPLTQVTSLSCKRQVADLQEKNRTSSILDSLSVFDTAIITTLIAFLAAAALAGIMIAERMVFERAYERSWSKVRQAEALAHIIALTDEKLTMSASMAAATGDSQWVSRYELALPVIDSAISSTMTLAPPEDAQRFSRETRLSNAHLVKLEKLAFTAVGKHQLALAQNILQGRRYLWYKSQLAAGTLALIDSMIRQCERRVQRQKAASHFVIALVLLSSAAAMIVLWLTVSRRLRVAQSRHKDAESRLNVMAHTDGLTGLSNRSRFEQQLAVITGETSISHIAAIAIIDVDRFKDVNDSLGHACGDELLISIASRLQEKLPIDGILARFGGDEFAVIISANETADAVKHFTGLREACAIPFNINGHVIRSSISIGISIWPSHALCTTELLRLADIALYEGKARGRDCVHLYDPSISHLNEEAHYYEQKLCEIIEQGNLKIDYFPVVDTLSGQTLAYEAMPILRQNSTSKNGFWQIVKLASESGRIARLNQAVFSALAKDMKLIDGLDIMIPIRLNQLRDPAFIDMLNNMLISNCICHKRLNLVIDGLDNSTSIEQCDHIMHRLHSCGVGLSSDIEFFITAMTRGFMCKYLRSVTIKAEAVCTALLDPEQSAALNNLVKAVKSKSIDIIINDLEPNVQKSLSLNYSCRIFQRSFKAISHQGVT